MNTTAFGQGLLPGWRVVVTRPQEQSEGLCRLIEVAGGHAVRFPLLAMAPSDHPECALATLRQLDCCDWLIFISANAVRFGCLLGGWWRELSARTRIAAIGRSTAEALVSVGLRVDLQPKAQFNSETLLEAPEWGGVAGRRIIIVRGRGGREKLADALRERGATVEYAEVYRRVPTQGDAASLIGAWRKGHIDALTLTSGDALRNLLRLLGHEHVDLLAPIPLAVIGERLAELARQAGCRRLAVASEASDEGLCEAVLRLARAT